MFKPKSRVHSNAGLPSSLSTSLWALAHTVLRLIIESATKADGVDAGKKGSNIQLKGAVKVSKPVLRRARHNPTMDVRGQLYNVHEHYIFHSLARLSVRCPSSISSTWRAARPWWVLRSCGC